MMERILISKFTVVDVTVMRPSIFRKEVDVIRKGYIKVKTIRWEMSLDVATDAEIDSYIGRKKHRIQEEGFGIPNLDTVTDAQVPHYVMDELTVIRAVVVDELMTRLIQRLPRNHRLANVPCDIPVWFQEIDKSVTTVKYSTFARPVHVLSNFGIHTQTNFNVYHHNLKQKSGKGKCITQAESLETTIVYVVREPLPIGDIIHTLITGRKSNTDMVTALRARERITTELLEVDRICTWVYWTVMHQPKRLQHNSYHSYRSSASTTSTYTKLNNFPQKNGGFRRDDVRVDRLQKQTFFVALPTVLAYSHIATSSTTSVISIFLLLY